MQLFENAKKKFHEVVALIDKDKHPEAYRLAWLVPLWAYVMDASAEQIAADFVENVDFWRWYYRQQPPVHDIRLMRDIFNAMDDEDKKG